MCLGKAGLHSQATLVEIFTATESHQPSHTNTLPFTDTSSTAKNHR